MRDGGGTGEGSGLMMVVWSGGRPGGPPGLPGKAWIDWNHQLAAKLSGDLVIWWCILRSDGAGL